jgi:parallel beta-helix repeat protein
VISSTGQNDESDHRAGVMNNKGSVCHVYSNTVSDTAGWGIYLQGNGTNRVYNNVIIRAGRFVTAGDTDGDGIALHDGSNTSNSIYVWNNTIIEARGDGIGFHNDAGSDNQIYNNLVIASGGEQIDTNPGDKTANNLVYGSAAPAGFANASADDFRLAEGSPAIDAGRVVSQVVVDRIGVGRPRGSGYDVGAYEFTG